MISNETSLNYKASDVVKHYNFDIRPVSIQGRSEKNQQFDLI